MRKLFILFTFTTMALWGCKKAAHDELPAPVVDLNVFQSNLIGTWNIGVTSIRYSTDNTTYEIVGDYKYKLIFGQNGHLTMVSKTSNLPIFYNSYVIRQEANKIILTFFDDSGVSRDYILLTYNGKLFTADMTASYSPPLTGTHSVGSNYNIYLYNREVFHYSFSKE